MKGILQKLLQRRGIESIDQLDSKTLPDGSPSEKDKFEEWDKTLSKEDLTIEDIKKFCQGQIDVIEGKWKDLNVDNSKKAELIPYHNVYKTLFNIIDSPRSSRESLENYLNQLLNN